jgi:hypothetical protein
LIFIWCFIVYLYTEIVNKTTELRTIAEFLLVLILVSGFSLSGYSQISVTRGANISATIVEPAVMTKTIPADTGNVAIMLIILPLGTGTHTEARYYYGGMTNYTYTNLSLPSSLIVKNDSNILKIASFISDPALTAGSNLIAGVFVSVTSSNVTVNYN